MFYIEDIFSSSVLERGRENGRTEGETESEVDFKGFARRLGDW